MSAVLVTGGASGIGRAIALRFADQGAAVTIGDRDADGAEAVAGQITARGGRAVAHTTDVADPAQVASLVVAAVAAHGALDAVVAAAGVLRTAPLAELTLAEFELHLRVNLTANLVLAQCAEQALAPGAGLVFVASLGALRGSAGSAAYNASKGGLVNLARSLADEFAPRGIRVNCLCPGWIDTPFNDPFWAHAGDDARERVAHAIPLGRQGTPDDVAPAAVFLAGPDAGFITGQTLVIDGGEQAT